jgi:hypothetical protein
MYLPTTYLGMDANAQLSINSAELMKLDMELKRYQLLSGQTVFVYMQIHYIVVVQAGTVEVLPFLVVCCISNKIIQFLSLSVYSLLLSVEKIASLHVTLPLRYGAERFVGRSPSRWLPNCRHPIRKNLKTPETLHML